MNSKQVIKKLNADGDIPTPTLYSIERQAIPAPQTKARHQANPDYAGGVWEVVDVPVEKYLGPAEKINITVPRLVLARIDEFAKKKGQSRSGFLVEAALTAMHA